MNGVGKGLRLRRQRQTELRAPFEYEIDQARQLLHWPYVNVTPPASAWRKLGGFSNPYSLMNIVPLTAQYLIRIKLGLPDSAS